MDNGTPVFRRPAPIRPATFVLSALKYLLKRREEFDVIHVFSFDSPALVGAIIKYLFPEKKYIQRIPRFGKGSAFQRLQSSRTGRARLRFILKQADAVIPLCPEATRALADLEFPQEKIAQIPNGVDIDLFSPADPGEKRILKVSFGIPEDAFTAIVVARLIPRKNVSTALKIWKKVVEAQPGSTLIIAGTGPEAPQLLSYAKEHFTGRRVVFAGNTAREELVRMMKTSDVYLSCSGSEGMSNAMLEAKSAGLPVVAARGPGIDQMVEHTRTGFLFDGEKSSEGFDYLLRLAEDSELTAKMSVAARQKIEAGFTFEKIVRAVERVYGGDPELLVPEETTESVDAFIPAGP